ncbi:MAG TPA: TRAP transporter substrate-binding protein [Candidatus Anaerobiospirillum stercoravium]|nr:TRAP transporter substrate-binding protein [Candidatus Anaerobiospirillum stercoravium]
MRVIGKLAGALALALAVSACSQQGASNSAEATADNPMVLALAHNMSETHTVHQAIAEFADEVNKRTDGRIQIKIFANGQLGSEVEAMEQVMAGVIAMTKVSAPGLATYDDAYHTFGLPYIFNDTADFYAVMDSDQMYDFFQTSYDKGFVTLTYYTSGARSFYTVDKPIRKPEDLYGLKIRVQDMRSQTEMVSVMGGTPVAMAYGDVFTSLQTGIIDGTENNETALTLGKHGEICKVFSLDEHAMIPDALLLSSKVWDTIAPADQQILIEAARLSTVHHQAKWDQSVKDAIAEAQNEMGVTFVYDVDKEAFRQATAGLVDKYSQEYPGVAQLLALIEQIRAQRTAGQSAAQSAPQPAGQPSAQPAAPSAL